MKNILLESKSKKKIPKETKLVREIIEGKDGSIHSSFVYIHSKFLSNTYRTMEDTIGKQSLLRNTHTFHEFFFVCTVPDIKISIENT